MQEQNLSVKKSVFPLMGNSTGNADNKSTTTSKNVQTEEKRWNRLVNMVK